MQVLINPASLWYSNDKIKAISKLLILFFRMNKEQFDISCLTKKVTSFFAYAKHM